MNPIWPYPLASHACPLINARIGMADAKYRHTRMTALVTASCMGEPFQKRWHRGVPPAEDAHTPLQSTLPGLGHWRRGGSSPRSWQLPVGRWSWWGRGHWSPWSAGCWQPGRTCVSCWGQWRSGASWRSSCLPPGAGPLQQHQRQRWPAWSTVPAPRPPPLPPPPSPSPAACHSRRRRPSTSCPSPSAAWQIHSAAWGWKGKDEKELYRVVKFPALQKRRLRGSLSLSTTISKEL